MTTPDGKQLNLTLIDGCPIQEDQISFALKNWLAVLADTLNYDLSLIQDKLNGVGQWGLEAPQLSATQISTLFAAGAPNGVLWYDTTNNEYVGIASGSLVKFTVTPYP